MRSNAVISAVKQQDKIRELSAKWKAEGKREFTVGMGINTGDVVMGNLGASSRMNYTVIGDNVNVAARLYNVAEGGEIIISEDDLRRSARTSSTSTSSSRSPSRARSLRSRSTTSKSLKIAAAPSETAAAAWQEAAIDVRSLPNSSRSRCSQALRFDGRARRRLHPGADLAPFLRHRAGRGGRNVAAADRRQQRERRVHFLRCKAAFT